MDMWRIGDNMAKAATLMTDTTFTSRLLGSAWPGHFNRPIAEAMYENIKKVGLPHGRRTTRSWRRALQKELKVPERGLATKIQEMRLPRPAAIRTPTTATGGREPADRRRLRRYRRRFLGRADRHAALSVEHPGGPGHNWANAIAMATPIAHKGVIAGAKVQAMTMLDILLHPELVKKPWDYFNNVQTKDMKYKSFLRPDDKPRSG